VARELLNPNYGYGVFFGQLDYALLLMGWKKVPFWGLDKNPKTPILQIKELMNT